MISDGEMERSISLGEQNSFTEDEIIDGEDIEDEEEPDELNSTDLADANPADRIGDLSNNLSSSVSKQQQVLRAHISILVSALGGGDYSTDFEAYKLGDDALACLKDIKRWLKSVDEQERKWDVALACSETGLVVNDLVPILAQWETDCLLKKVKNPKFMERVALSVVELLVPLTWPLLLTKDSSPNQVDHYFNLTKAQLTYKKLILQFQGGKALRAVVRLTLPIISKSKGERSARDHAILRLCIYFFRNILKIEPARSTLSSKAASKGNNLQDNFPTGVTFEDISSNTVIESYSRNNVLQLLLTVTSLLSSDLDEEMLNIGCLECLYLLTNEIDVASLFKTLSNDKTEKPQIVTESTALLKDLLAMEQKMRKTVIKSSSSRHGRFGTLLSLQTIDNDRLTISGGKGLSDRSASLTQLDSTKEWRPTVHLGMNMKFAPTTELEENLGRKSGKKFLSRTSSNILVKFIDDFIEGCFNPLSYSLRRKFLSADEPSLNTLQFFELVTWIIGYETEKRITYSGDHVEENGHFTNVLQDDFFTLVITTMRKATENHVQWSLVLSCMKCFKQILSFADLIGSTSIDPNDQLISHNLKHRLFNKELTLDMLATLPKNAYKISEDYVKTVVELTYVVLKTLESFSKDDESIYIATKRKRPERVDDSDDEEQTSLKMKSLNFQKYQLKFIHRDTIQTHISLFERYQEISEQDLKRCLSYFYRVFYICERHLDLFRIDFMILLHQMTGNGPKSLPRSSSFKKELINFTKYFMKKLMESLEKAPSLFVELCFNSSLSLSHRIRSFLEKGEIVKEEKSYVVARELFFKRGYEIDLDRKFAIIVSFMIDHGDNDLVKFVKEQLSVITDRRSKWIEEQQLLDNDEENSAMTLSPPVETIIFTDEKSKKLLIKNSRLRLLLKTIGFDLPETLLETCDLPSDLTANQLRISLLSIEKYLEEAVKFPVGQSAADYVTKSYDDVDDDNEFWEITPIRYGVRNTYDADAADIAFETGRMDIKSQRVTELDRLDELESSLRRKRPLGQARRKNRGKLINGSKRSQRRKRRPNRLEMHDVSDVESPDPRRLQRGNEYRSAEFIQDSDDEDEVEFFSKELFLRQLLELHSGTLLPEHAKLFKDNSWKSYKITATGEVRPNASQFQALDDLVKSRKMIVEQESSKYSQDVENINPLLSANETNESNIQSSEDDQISSDEQESQNEDIHSDIEPTTLDSKKRPLSVEKDAQNRKAIPHEDAAMNDSSKTRKKLKRVINSENEDDI